MYTCAYRSNNKKANKNLVNHNTYSIQNQELSIVRKGNPASVKISEKLSWNYHMDATIIKANKNLSFHLWFTWSGGFSRQEKNKVVSINISGKLSWIDCMDATIKKQLNDNLGQLPPPKSQHPAKGYQSTICYHTLVRPTLEYVLPVWHGVHIPHQTTTSCKELNQTRAARDGLVISDYKVAIDERLNGPLAVLTPGRKNCQTLAGVHCVTYKPIDIPTEVLLHVP